MVFRGLGRREHKRILPDLTAAVAEVFDVIGRPTARLLLQLRQSSWGQSAGTCYPQTVASAVQLDNRETKIAHVSDGRSDFIAQQIHSRTTQQLRGNCREAFQLMIEGALLALHGLDRLGL